VTAGTRGPSWSAGDLPVPQIHPALDRAFRALGRAGVTWALLRGADDLTRPSGDVDLLVAPDALPLLDDVLEGAGLHRMGMRGHGSHRFYFCFADDGSWVKLDVVSRIDFGRYHELPIPVAGACLERRRVSGPVWRLAPEDEAWLYLLHLLLDKGAVVAGRRESARTAAGAAATDSPVARHLDSEMGPDVAQRIRDAVLTADAGITSVTSSWLRATWTRRHPVRARWARYRNRLLRRLELPVRLRSRGLVVALVGPDGAGKTTLSQGLISSYPVPARSVYMGLWQTSRWDGPLGRIPGGRVLQRTARIVRSAVVVRWHRRRGRLVLLDRFPQDALLPGGDDTSRGGRFNLFLATHLPPATQLVLLLDAPGQLMFARKGEHTPDLLEERRQAYLELVGGFRHAAVLDASAQADHVRRDALAAIWDRLHGWEAHREPIGRTARPRTAG
jgi:thymidylate kinase